MKKISIIFLSFMTVLILLSFGYKINEGIRISVTNVRSDRGTVLVSLFKDGVGFPDNPEKAVKRIKLSLSSNKAEVLFTNLTAGTYAVAILHDENNDQKLNKNILGIPKEGFGFSNNVMGTFGPPSFTKASFQHQQGQLTQVTIRTKYF
ncbi:MAG TPA: DUF2141 domain-containing protein [Chitinophagaceae bacterium]|nr:DUF2141 domain-containing protein [Chitinophagaceae bacterium]HMU57780.1 DUF2141 domain-containing protein [Chitinophagaceae bacterium]